MSAHKEKSKILVNREISWLEFNDRVLHEAHDPSNPLLERLKFLAIVSSNLDEFFMVRVGGLKRQKTQNDHRRCPAGLTPIQQLEAISRKAHRMIERQYRCLNEDLTPNLLRAGVARRRLEDMDPVSARATERYFEEELFPVLTPLAADPDPPRIAGLTLHLAALLDKADAASDDERNRLAIIPIPHGWVRYFQVPSEGAEFHYVLVEDLIMHYAERFFPGYAVREIVPFRITRNADVPLDDEVVSDLVEAMEDVLRNRKTGFPVRLNIQSRASEGMKKRLLAMFELDSEDVYLVDGPLDLTSFMTLISAIGLPKLKYPPFQPQPLQEFEEAESLFDILRERDVLLHPPYDAYDPVIRLLQEAAEDSRVLAIKQTLYRTSSKSPIIDALARAAENGKQVTVLVELKARFDEGRNIHWARRLSEAGAHVVYGVMGYKTHAKILMIVRRESGGVQRYVHLSTGNYNERTARLYEDLSLLTTDADIGGDAAHFFNAVTGYSEARDWLNLILAPTHMRRRIYELIDREIARSSPHDPGVIMIKMNSLVDTEMCLRLHEAARKGVRVKLCVRGICCLRPRIAGPKENIEIVSIVGRFLEHSRIYYFRNGGEEEIYLSSADLMPRNLDRRIEIMFPVQDEENKHSIIEFLNLVFSDNQKAWRLQQDGSYVKTAPQEGESPRSTQETMMEKALARAEISLRRRAGVFVPKGPGAAPGVET